MADRSEHEPLFGAVVTVLGENHPSDDRKRNKNSNRSDFPTAPSSQLEEELGSGRDGQQIRAHFQRERRRCRAEEFGDW